MYTHIHVYIYIYIYIERERYTHTHTYIHTALDPCVKRLQHVKLIMSQTCMFRTTTSGNIPEEHKLRQSWALGRSKLFWTFWVLTPSNLTHLNLPPMSSSSKTNTKRYSIPLLGMNVIPIHLL